mgnify:CR=1 FL=1
MDKRQIKLVKQARENKFRRQILELGLKDSESISQILKIDIDDAKRHLTILKRCGLVTYRNENIVSQRVFKIRQR